MTRISVDEEKFNELRNAKEELEKERKENTRLVELITGKIVDVLEKKLRVRDDDEDYDDDDDPENYEQEYNETKEELSALRESYEALRSRSDLMLVSNHSRNQLVDTVTKENAALQEWVADLQSGMYVNCVYCGHRYGPKGTTPVDALKAHIENCPKHPMFALKKKAIRILAALKETEFYYECQRNGSDRREKIDWIKVAEEIFEGWI